MATVRTLGNLKEVSRRTSTERVALGALLLAAAFVLGACGGGSASEEREVTPAVPATQRPASREPQGKIAFTAEIGSGAEVYVVEAQDGGASQLTDQAAVNQWPRWSPDGQYLALVRKPAGSGPITEPGELVVVGADGAERQVISGAAVLEAYAAPFAWSPDATRIVYKALNRSDVAAGLNLVDVASGQVTELAAGRLGAMPDWSPDGSRIAFVSNKGEAAASNDPNLEIYIMNADGSDIRPLTDHEGTDIAPQWSPDGTRIAWWVRKPTGAPHDLFVTDVGKPKPKELGTGSRPVWSADGDRLAFLDQIEGQNVDIFVLDLRDGRKVNVTGFDGEDTWPAWSADGSKIAFVSPRDNDRGEIYVVDADGSNLIRLTENDEREAFLDWSPD